RLDRGDWGREILADSGGEDRLVPIGAVGRGGRILHCLQWTGPPSIGRDCPRSDWVTSHDTVLFPRPPCSRDITLGQPWRPLRLVVLRRVLMRAPRCAG